LVDQFSKFLVRELLRFRESFPEDGFFRITHTYNTGSAFGLFRDQNTPLILVSFIGITILVLIYRSQPRPGMLLRLSLGLQMGGAAGNLLDRLRLGHVIDFIDVGAWPVFNLADASIVVGLLLLVWLFLGPRRTVEGRVSNRAVGDFPSPLISLPHVEEQQRLAADDRRSGYSWCPICDGEMMSVLDGWRCSTCGVRETLVNDSARG
jgi:signal peptidase II